MRKILLFRGAPGAGKSYFIEKNNLRKYVISPDTLREMYQSPVQNVDGRFGISQENDGMVWKTVFSILEERMFRGEFVVIDATNSKTEEMSRYKKLAQEYRYRIYIVDLTDLPIEECKRRNMLRPEYKQVPDFVIDKMYTRFKEQKIPSGITKINSIEELFLEKFDMNKYEKIVHIGDIRGCYSVINKYFNNGINDNYMYIFTGNYFGTGKENDKVADFMYSIKDRKNVLFLEGSTDFAMWKYANGVIDASKTYKLFHKFAGEQLIKYKSKLREIYRKVGQCAWYTYNGIDVLVTNGGIARMPENLTYMASNQIINGVGTDVDMETVATSWMNNHSDIYQIFGNRNPSNVSIQVNDRVFNLYNDIEYGGNLRIVELDKTGFTPIEIKNEVYRDMSEITNITNTAIDSKLYDIVYNMRHSKYIREKKFGNISSFNFTRDAFYKGAWNKQTVVARGLYVNTEKMKIVARGFNKFFNIGERPETENKNLKHILKFPVTAYVKENGYLGLVAYDEESNDLMYTSKSDPTGPFAKWVKAMVEKKMTPEAIEKMKAISRDENVTFIFEVVDMENDPHIIDYDDSMLYLLSIVKNDINFEQYDYNVLCEIAKNLGIPAKEKAIVLNTWEEFFDWQNEVTAEDYKYNGRNIEGFVIEDSKGYMVKLKLYFYKYWKKLRSVADKTLKYGAIESTTQLFDVQSNEFYAFLQNIFDTHTKEELENFPKGIIALRKMFLEQKNK